MQVSDMGVGDNADDQPLRAANESTRSDRDTNWSFGFSCLGILLHIFDLLLDIYWAIKYFSENKTYFWCTIMFMLLPTILTMWLSFRLAKSTTPIWKKIWCIRASIHLLHLAPIFHNGTILKYASKSGKSEKDNVDGDREVQQDCYRKMKEENEELAALKIFDGFLETAMQQVLQLVILFSGNDITDSSWIRIGSLCFPFISMGFTLVIYDRNIRYAQQNESKINRCGLICQLLWHSCIAVSRIVSIGFIASKWLMPTIVCCIIHWLVMTSWLVIEPDRIPSFYRNNVNSPSGSSTLKEKITSVFLAAAVGLVYIFDHLNPGGPSTLNKDLLYYVVCEIENLLVAILWALDSDKLIGNYLFLKVLLSPCVMFFIAGIIFMILYYKLSHPTSSDHDSFLEKYPCRIVLMMMFVIFFPILFGFIIPLFY